MKKYIFKRILSSLITLWVMFTITFLVMHMIPGDPFIGDKTPPAKIIANLNAKFGLDKPLPVQYARYLLNAVSFDFGPSISKLGQTVNDIIGRAFPVSMRLGLLSIFLSVFFGTLFGIIGALKRNTLPDRIVMVISTLGIAVPGFVVATVSIILFSVTLRLLPIRGLESPLHYIMPSIALSFLSLSFITRLTRSSMLDVINQDYIRTARAKGLPEKIVILKHALKNGILPVVSYLGPLFATILTGSFVIEKLFAIPGLGRYFVDSITNRDYPLIMGVTIFYGAFLIIMSFIVDMVYVFIDPRIKITQ